MSIQVKNDWDYVGNDRWDWEIYVTSEDQAELDDINSVKYVLHPTFKNPIREVKNPQGGFRLKTNGWGTFKINVFINLKNGKVIKREHRLELQYNPPSGTSN